MQTEEEEKIKGPDKYQNHFSLSDRRRTPFALDLRLGDFLAAQEFRLFNPTLLDVDEHDQKRKTRQTQGEEKVEGRGVVARVVDDGAGYQGSDERAGFPDDGEEAEEEKFFTTRGDFADHLEG